MPAMTIATVIPTYNAGDRLFRFRQAWAEAGAAESRVRVCAVVLDDGSRGSEARRQGESVSAAAEKLRQSGRRLRADGRARA